MAKWVMRTIKGESEDPEDKNSDPVFELPDVFKVTNVQPIPLLEGRYEYLMSYIEPLKG